MGLSDDQRAMLRLLAQRGEEGYDDVAALMGLTVEEVRAKVADALAELAKEGALAPSQAKPAVPSAEPATPPAAEPVAEPEPEPEVAAKPEPQPPAQPAAAVKPPAAPAGPVKRPRPAPPKISLPSGNGPRAAIAAAILVVVAVVVVLIAGGGGNSGTDSSTTSASSTTSGETTSGNQATPTSNSAEVTKAVLKPVGAGSASGVAIFGRVKNSLALQVIAKGLAPTTKGSTEYTVWLAQSPQRMLPLASTPVKADGRIGAQFEVPTEVLAYLANGTFDQLVITRTANSALEASLAKATKEERAPTYTGTEVLRGTVVGPIVGAAKRLEEEKAEKGK